MFGAVVGDIIGSRHEWNPIKTKEFDIFHMYGTFTDDSVLTCAIAYSTLHGYDLKESIKSFALKYPNRPYGVTFQKWFKDGIGDCKSWSNGSAMRVSAIGWAFNTREEVLEEAKKSAEVTHNSPEGIRGAQAVALAIFLARKGFSKRKIKKDLSKTFGYNLNRRLKDIRPGYELEVNCETSVPEAIICFLESRSFEDAIRNAISLGGDSDTQAAIAGSIAEAFYKNKEIDVIVYALRKLDSYLLDIIVEFGKKFLDENYIELVLNELNKPEQLDELPVIE